MTMRNARTCLSLIATAAIFTIVLAAASPPASAAGVVSDVSGLIGQRQTITISGSSFGDGPSGIVFDDFEGGTDGNSIMIGSGSAAVGEWNSAPNDSYYSDDYSVSGSLCFEADMGSGTSYLERTYPSGVAEIFICWWVRIPEKMPGIDSVDRINWKHVWVMGDTSTADDDLTPTFLGPVAYEDSCSLGVFGNCGIVTTWTGWSLHSEYEHGDWVREHWHIKGGYTDGYYRLDMLTADGDRIYREATGRTWGHRDGDENGLPRQYERVRFNGYGRTTSGCYPRYDDCYSAYGPNCRARVEIGNASTYNSCTALAICPPTSWSSGSISALVNVGGLNPAEQWYLFVVDAAGDVSAGYPVASDVHTLTVNSGTGGGDYLEGTVVPVSADPPPSGQVFDVWTGQTAGVADVNDPVTTITMPAGDAEITATYRSAVDFYTLTVNSGSGDGSYLEGTVVAIVADAPPSWHLFDQWVGDTAGIADVQAAATTITMPSAAVTITATYQDTTVGLFSYYTFDVDGSDSVGTNHGTLINGAAVAADPERGNVLTLDGDNDFVNLPADNMAAGRSELTVAFWIYPDEWVSTNTIYDEYGGDWDQYWQFTIRQSGWYTRDASTGPTGSRTNDLAMPSVPAGEWHHLAFVYSVSQPLKRIYYDGEPFASATNSVDALTTSRAGVRIGWPCDGTYCDGKIDEMRFYDRALSPAEIALLAAETYTLTVNSGTGDGTYPEGTVVGIVADPAPSGQEFDVWTGDTGGIADTGAASTTITMPAGDAEVTATYQPILHHLTVNSGTGDGDYAAGTPVEIVADPAPSGQEFDVWTGDTGGIAGTGAASTTITMPAANAEITATYIGPYWRGDLNEDEFVGQTDLDIVLDQWGNSGGEITDGRADPNNDNFVGQTDLDIVLDDWGKSGRQPL